ncbi:Inward rectifier potassium channel irk-1 [Aphelenchoides besseyi]|nr:Inward rectifier potassium channel irk-1 [Aphelenchoides besseyi]
METKHLLTATTSSPQRCSQSNDSERRTSPAPVIDKYERNRFLRPRIGSRRIRNRLVQKYGIVNISLVNVPKQHRKYFRFFTLVYYTIALYHGDFEHIDNPNWKPCVSNGDTFFNLYIFSFTTQSTIGYGFRYATDSCPLTIMTMCVQFMTGVVLQTLMAGVIFAKLARPIKRAATILFSKHAVICQRDGKLCLLFRVGDMRKSSLAEAHIRLQMIKKCVTLENEVLPFHQFDMNVGYDSGLDRVFVIWPITICHEIDESSPLYDVSKKSLANSRFEIIAILEGVVESVGSTTQARTSYLPNEILWGKRFEKLVTYQRDNGEYLIDFEKFHNVFDVDMPECSARELDEMRSTSRSSGTGLLKKVSFEDIPRPVDRNSIPTVSLPNVNETSNNREYNDRCIIIDSSDDEKEELNARVRRRSCLVSDESDVALRKESFQVRRGPDLF